MRSSGIRHLASGIRHMASGIRHLATGDWHLATGIGISFASFLVNLSARERPTTKSFAFGPPPYSAKPNRDDRLRIRYLASGIWHLKKDTFDLKSSYWVTYFEKDRTFQRRDLFSQVHVILQTTFAAIFLPYGKSDIKAIGFCDIIFALISTVQAVYRVACHISHRRYIARAKHEYN